MKAIIFIDFSLINPSRAGNPGNFGNVAQLGKASERLAIRRPQVQILPFPFHFYQRGGDNLDAQKIADRLIKLRGSRTQAEVAQAIGVTPSAYSMYENGDRIPRDEIKKRIAEYYKRTVNTIFFAD